MGTVCTGREAVEQELADVLGADGVEISDDGTVIQVHNQYNYVDLNFDQLQAATRVLGTDYMNLQERSRDGYAGCSTCDHGSRYTITLWIGEEKLW